MSLELIGKFIGPDEIVSVTLLDIKTPKMGEVYEIGFSNERRHIFSKTTLNLVVTETISDLNEVQEKKMIPMLNEIMDIISEYDLTTKEVSTLSQKLSAILTDTFDRTTSFLWFKDKKEHVIGFDPLMNVSILMTRNIMKDGEQN